jgi:hypothetical protein
MRRRLSVARTDRFSRGICTLDQALERREDT